MNLIIYPGSSWVAELPDPLALLFLQALLINPPPIDWLASLNLTLDFNHGP